MLPKIVWPYSLFQKVWNFVYFSGQIGLVPETWKLAWNLREQTYQACENILALCKEANIEITDIIKTTIFVTDMSEYALVNEVYAEYFSHKPVRSCVAVKELPAWAEVEIECIAHKEM